MYTRRIAIFALLAVVVVATGCAAMVDQEDEGAMSPQPTAAAFVITGSQAIPTPAPSMSKYTDAPIRYQVALWSLNSPNSSATAIGRAKEI